MKQELYAPLQLELIKKEFAAYCSFSLGATYICEQMPIFDYLWVKRELERGKEAFQLLVKYGMPPFEGIEDTTQSIQGACKDKTLLPHELRKIATGMKICLHIQQYNKESELNTPQIKELISSFQVDQELLSQIEDCISINDDIVDCASIELNQIRKQMRQCENDVHKIVQQFIQTHASSLMDTITTKRNDRVCVLVKISEKNNIRGFLHGESASGLTAYIEPACILQLNNTLQSLKDQEQKEIEKILIALSKGVKEHSYCLLANLETLALLDACFAKAAWCYKREGCFAEMKRHERRLYFQNARHPFISEDKVVANTYELRPPYDSLLITGSNTGGKTVTLKTIGLFVILTMAGFPILAQEAEVPFYDGVYIDIGDDQSIQESLSTFSSHLSKLSFICKEATKNSLVILDELGSGTDPKEGEALAVALLTYLRKKHAMVLATTHFSALKNYASQQDTILLSSVAFDMEEMKPTYRYQEGISGTSNAFEIAARFQLDAAIIEEAKAFKKTQKSKWEEQSEKLEMMMQENNALKHQLEEKIANVHQLQKDLEVQKEQMKKQKEAWIKKAQTEAKEYMEVLKEQADQIMKDLKQLSHDSKPHEYIALKKELDALEPKGIENNEPIAYHFAIGDYVHLKSFHCHGEIVELQKDQATILVNGIKMKAFIKDMELIEKPLSKQKEKGYTTVKTTSFSMELNIIGMYVKEAIAVVDKYLDNAILAKVYHVRIIHGNGSGALRLGIHKYLKKHKLVENFHVAGHGEGGLGATNVILKQRRKTHG